MGVTFSIGMLAYYALFLRKRGGHSSELARLLWITYFALGCSAAVIELTKVLEPVFSPNYPAILFLWICIIIGITGFLGFRSRAVEDVITFIRGQALIEGILISLQLFAIAFFFPFASSSLSGDVAMNRLEVSSRADLMAAYGNLNTIAGMASHLFAVSLALAFIRLCQPAGEGYSLLRAALLALSSLSYVVYVLAYVGRDGSIYWLMTALLMFMVFRNHMAAQVRRRIVVLGTFLGVLVLVPLVTITMARFTNSDFGVSASLFEYFGSQLHHFSDFSSIERPMMNGAMNFPLFRPIYCSISGNLSCEQWENIRLYVFDIYLSQGKPPWLFATYVSDFVSDFGYVGTLGLLLGFSFICHRACVGRDSAGRMSPSRLLLVIFLFLTPYWGVFYFRFGIINSFIVANLAFIIFVWAVQMGYRGSRSASGGNTQESDVRFLP